MPPTDVALGEINELIATQDVMSFVNQVMKLNFQDLMMLSAKWLYKGSIVQRQLQDDHLSLRIWTDIKGFDVMWSLAPCNQLLYFQEIPKHGFRLGMKVEAVDLMEPRWAMVMEEELLANVSGTKLTWILYPAAGGWVGRWGFLWWAPSAKRKDHHGVSSG